MRLVDNPMTDGFHEDRITWEKIWINRKVVPRKSRHETMIASDGFDSLPNLTSELHFYRVAMQFANTLPLNKFESIYEVGCGSGAFLYPLYCEYGCRVGGVDLSPELVELANQTMRDGKFSVGDAIVLDTKERYDHVFAHSVLQYFVPSVTEQVLVNMVLKSNLTVSVLDIPNQLFLLEQEQLRERRLGQDNYRERYRSLKHTYYSKSFFRDFAERNNLHITEFNSSVGDLPEDYRFGVIMRKSDRI